VLELGEEADKLLSMRDYHAAELCYLHALKILPEHAQSLCNYAYLLQTGKKELAKAEELYNKALQADPERTATLCNYAHLLRSDRRPQEARDMYARACELEPTNSWIQKYGYLSCLNYNEVSNSR
jgi:Tfp pilus assembly protein PilF